MRNSIKQTFYDLKILQFIGNMILFWNTFQNIPSLLLVFIIYMWMACQEGRSILKPAVSIFSQKIYFWTQEFCRETFNQSINDLIGYVLKDI